MILRRFPGSGPPAQASQADFDYFGRENVVVYARSRDISFAEHTAPLSLKTTLKGRETYEVDGVPVAVDEGAYLVLNNDQPYSSCIRSDEDVESLCVFFRDGLEEEVLAPFTHSHRKLIDQGRHGLTSPVRHFQNRRQQDRAISRCLRQLHAHIADGMTSRLWFDEQYNLILESLLQKHLQIAGEIEQLPFARSATRLEIHQRLHRARDYLESCFTEPVSLERLASVACLSRHHFLRLFKATFGMTPHRYMTEVRLQRARRLLGETGTPVSCICREVGFENESSFARLFRRRFGCPPTRLRRSRPN